MDGGLVLDGLEQGSRQRIKVADLLREWRGGVSRTGFECIRPTWPAQGAVFPTC
jgi:hypothetical protein